MADGYDFHLDPDRTRQLTEAADAAGLSLQDYMLTLVDDAIAEANAPASGDGGWAEDMARLERYRQSGTRLPFNDAMDRIRSDLAKRGVGET